MSNDRDRLVIDDEYAHALGVAAYCFAICEWNAVWCAEKLQAGYVITIEAERKTAGRIATELEALTANISDAAIRLRGANAAADFVRVTKERNGLLHGKPGTAPGGEQRLFRNTGEWTIAAINRFADEAAACSIELNDLLHNHLP